MTPSSKNALLQFIDAARVVKGLSREGLAKAAGLSRDVFRKLDERGPSGTLKLDSLRRIAGVLEVEIDQLISAATGNDQQAPVRSNPPRGEVRPATTTITRTPARDIPVMGTAAGSAIGSFQITTDVIDYVGRPPGLMGARDIYALYVENESMVPKFGPGDLVFVHPNKPIAHGDAMIVQIANGSQGEIEGYIKIYKGRTAEHIIAEQFNPQATIRYARNTVVAIHKVLTLNELFGA